MLFNLLIWAWVWWNKNFKRKMVWYCNLKNYTVKFISKSKLIAWWNWGARKLKGFEFEKVPFFSEVAVIGQTDLPRWETWQQTTTFILSSFSIGPEELIKILIVQVIYPYDPYAKNRFEDPHPSVIRIHIRITDLAPTPESLSN